MNAVLAVFHDVRDPRAPNARYPLDTILMLAFCATVCGCQNCVEFAESCEDAQDILAEFIDLPDGTPSYDCFSRTLRLLDPAELQRALVRILTGLREGLASPAAPSGAVAVDGKRLERLRARAHLRARPLMVSIWDAQTRLSLAAAPAPARNEVAGVLGALASLDLTGRGHGRCPALPPGHRPHCASPRSGVCSRHQGQPWSAAGLHRARLRAG